MDYPKSTPNVGLVGGKFVDENTSTGQPGSLIPAAWGNAVTEELLAVIVAAGLTPSESDLTQLQKAIQSLAASDVKRTVRVATTGAIALSGVQSIDGVAVVAGDRVLVKDQAAGAQNGIYTVAAAAWVRALDMNESAECTPGHLVLVENGAANAGSIWQLSNVTLPTLGTTPLVYARMYGKTGVGAGTYRSVTVDVQGRVVAGSNPNTLSGYGISDAYTQAQVNNLLNSKADKATTLGGYGITDSYTQTQVNNLLAGKAAKATTLSGYGITDALPLLSTVPTDISTVVSSSVIYQNPSGGHQNALGASAGCVLTVSLAGASGFQLYGRDSSLLFRGHTGDAYSPVRTVYHSGNFDPDSKADKSTTLAGYGIVAATQAEAEEQTSPINTKPMTPLRVFQFAKLGFSASFEKNGYIVFPKFLGGLIIQWGEATAQPSASTLYGYNIAFPNAMFFNGAQPIAGVVVDVFVRHISQNLTQFTLDTSSSTTHLATWWAFGR